MPSGAVHPALRERQIDVTHSVALEIVAAQHGLQNWNVLAAKIGEADPQSDVRFGQTCPILRIFDEPKAKQFYLDFLGFKLDWEHRFGDNFPLYAQVSRAGLMLHLSEHYGDASPGSTVFVRMEGIRAYQQELSLKHYTFGKPDIEDQPWGLVMTLTDPFNNRVRFCQERREA